MSNGDLSPQAYENMKVVAGWMARNGASIEGTKPLPSGESASVPATSKGSARYLFAGPQFRNDGSYAKDYIPPTDMKVTLARISAKPSAVRLLGDGGALDFTASDNVVSVQLPAARRSELVDVVQIELSREAEPAAAAADSSTDLRR
jgi:hypothetical protein